jgi:hypothetical protein
MLTINALVVRFVTVILECGQLNQLLPTNSTALIPSLDINPVQNLETSSTRTSFGLFSHIPLSYTPKHFPSEHYRRVVRAAALVLTVLNMILGLNAEKPEHFFCHVHPGKCWVSTLI